MSLICLKFHQIKTNVKYKVVDLQSQSKAILNCLSAMGIELGTEITLLSKRIIGSGSPFAILVNNNENIFMLRTKEAESLTLIETE